MNALRFVFSKTFLKNLIYAGVLAALILVGTSIYLKVFTDHGNVVTVPDVRSLNVTEAQNALEAQDLGFLVIDSVYRAGAIGGTILEQTPFPNSEVKSEREVYLTIYRISPPDELIKVNEGMNEGVAQIVLQNKGINYKTKYESNHLLSGMVVRVEYKGSSIRPEDRVPRGDEVLLVIGKGGDEKVLVPNVEGMTLDSADKKLMASQLSLGLPFYDKDVITKEDSSLARVYAQTPSARRVQRVRIGSPVDVYLGFRIVEVDSTQTEMPE
jgi:eukaryotic-like serine/threonine-protein kinase